MAWVVEVNQYKCTFVFLSEFEVVEQYCFPLNTMEVSFVGNYRFLVFNIWFIDNLFMSTVTHTCSSWKESSMHPHPPPNILILLQTSSSSSKHPHPFPSILILLQAFLSLSKHPHPPGILIPLQASSFSSKHPPTIIWTSQCYRGIAKGGKSPGCRVASRCRRVPNVSAKLHFSGTFLVRFSDK